MTPKDFAAAYRDTAAKVSAGTGLDNVVLEAQWANETAWGTVVVGNNLGNIRCSPTSFCRYASLDEFASACIATFHNGFYDAVLAAQGPQAQLAALVASPWSSSHYGGSLQAFYDPLEVYEMQPDERQWLYNTQANEGTTVNTVTSTVFGNAALLAAIKAIPGGTVDTAAILAAIADLKAHPTFDPNDATILAIVQRIENALRAA